MATPIDDDVIDELRDLRANGMTYGDIGDQLGISPATARRYTAGTSKGYKTETAKRSNGHANVAGNGTATATEAPRPLVPTAFACPWCSKPVIAPAAEA